jgi:glycine/D-amino acid oxidase-like deaminating enzyme
MPAPPAEPLDGEARCDVAVIGGGYGGLSAALHLAEQGADVRLLEAEKVGFGASGRNNGQVIPGLRYDSSQLTAMLGPVGARLGAFGAEAGDLVFDLIERHRIDCQARRSGWLQLAHAPAMADAARKRAEQCARLGIDAEFLDRARTAAVLGTDRYHGAFLDRRAGCLHPLNYARGLAAAAKRLGARIHEQSPARKIERTAQGWRVRTDQGAVSADKLVIATNAYSDDLWPGLKRSIIPAQSIQIATPVLAPELRARILPGGEVGSDTQRIILYYRMDPDGRFIMGGRGSFGEVNPPALFAYLERMAVRLFPFLKGQRWDYRWGGKIAMTTDFLPRLHAPGDGAFIALGCNGRGIALATGLGKVLADLARRALPPAEAPLPVTPVREIPMHAFRRPALEAITYYYRLRDLIG